MAHALVNIRMEEALKKDLENTCKELGMNVTTAFTIFAKKLTREKRIPFEVSVNRYNDADAMQALRESWALDNDPKAKTFSTVAELMADLENDDD